MVIVVALDHRSGVTGSEAFDFGEGEKSTFGRFTGSDAESFGDSLNHVAGASEST